MDYRIRKIREREYPKEVVEFSKARLWYAVYKLFGK